MVKKENSCGLDSAVETEIKNVRISYARGAEIPCNFKSTCSDWVIGLQ